MAPEAGRDYNTVDMSMDKNVQRLFRTKAAVDAGVGRLWHLSMKLTEFPQPEING
jgi:hypothetical protein